MKRQRKLRRTFKLINHYHHHHLSLSCFQGRRPCVPFRSQHRSTDMRRLTTGLRSEKCVVRRFRRRANVIECTYTNLDSIAYYTPRLHGIAYCS